MGWEEGCHARNVCVVTFSGEAITRIAQSVETVQRRKKVLLFIGSDMFWQAYRTPGQAYQDPGCERPLEDARTAMFAAVDRTNLTVHSIDPQGLVNAAAPAHASQSTLTNRSRPAGLDAVWGSTSHPMSGRQNLSVLPDRTGGRVVAGRNNPEQMVPQILDESSGYYVIAIERGRSPRPDEMRRVEIKMRRKGVHVASQRLYAGLAEPPATASHGSATTTTSTLDDALSGLLPRDDIPLSLALTPFANPESATPIVRVSIDVAAFVRTDGAPVPLDIAIVAVDAVGRRVASARQTSTITAARASGPPATVDVQSHLPLAPGDYGVRVAVSDPAAAKVASVFSDVTVPNYADAPLSLSGVSVEHTGTPGGEPVTTTRRGFKRTEQVRAVLQMYQGTDRTDPLASVTMRMRILNSKGVAVHDQSSTYPAASFSRRRAGCVIALPLATLSPGDYLIKFEASASRHASVRTLRITVE